MQQPSRVQLAARIDAALYSYLDSLPWDAALAAADNVLHLLDEQQQPEQVAA